jgi:hypothetical protein
VPVKKNGGIFVVPVEINGALTLEFGVDSGAADVSIPLDVFSTLKRTGTLRDSDIIGRSTYVLADGSKSRRAFWGDAAPWSIVPWALQNLVDRQ